MIGCLICFVLGYLVARMMRGSGLCIGGKQRSVGHVNENHFNLPDTAYLSVSPNYLGGS